MEEQKKLSKQNRRQESLLITQNEAFLNFKKLLVNLSMGSYRFEGK
jgi:hypothetical protein